MSNKKVDINPNIIKYWSSNQLKNLYKIIDDDIKNDNIQKDNIQKDNIINTNNIQKK